MDFDYRAMTIQHRGRPAVIAFDFIPPRPTTAQLAALCCQDCGCCLCRPLCDMKGVI